MHRDFSNFQLLWSTLSVFKHTFKGIDFFEKIQAFWSISQARYEPWIYMICHKHILTIKKHFFY